LTRPERRFWIELISTKTTNLSEVKMAEIGKPEKRRVLVPEEMPQPARVVPAPKSPVKVPEREPA
jgi:hypothetical protein